MLSEQLNQALTEGMKMIGFKPAGRSTPDVVARIKACWDYNPKGAEGKKFTPDVKVVLMGAAKKDKAFSSGQFTKQVRSTVLAALKKEGMYPSPGTATCVGLAEVGAYNEQNSWSDDSFYAIRGDNDKIAQAVAKALEKVVKVRGGGATPGSSYKGRGLSGGAGEYVYHYSSFGIGD